MFCFFIGVRATRILFRQILFLLLLLGGWIGFALEAGANERRVALVIGNASYTHVPRLLNPANDAQDLAQSLRRIGFDVTEAQDLDYRGLRLAVRDFSERAEGADIALVYYAGHGIEIDNVNYLIPVNAELKRAQDVDFEALRLDALLSAIAAPKGLKIVLIDACRDNPFRVSMRQNGATRSIGRGLARVEPSGVLVGYAAKGGTYALDGQSRNSPYAQALMEHLETPGLELGKLFRKVRDSVYQNTDQQQEPFVYGSLPGRDIYLVDPLPVAMTAVQPAPVVAPVPSPVDRSDAELLEQFAFASGTNTPWRWRQFLKEFADFPDHRLIGLAEERLQQALIQEDLDRGYRIAEPWLDPSVDPETNRYAFTREERRQIQDALNMMGHDTGGIDGQFGPRTRSAIAQARMQAGIVVSSEVDLALLRVLPNAPSIRDLMPEKARSIDVEDLPEDVEPRLRKAIAALGNHPVLFDYYQGNLYFAVNARSFSWSAINLMAKEAGGHLAVISSAGENQFLVDLFSRDPVFMNEHESGIHGPMFGLYQSDRSNEPRGGWTWINGEQSAYRNWSPGNPDNYQAKQHYSRFYVKRQMRSRYRYPQFWDDASGNSWTPGFLVEIE